MRTARYVLRAKNKHFTAECERLQRRSVHQIFLTTGDLHFHRAPVENTHRARALLHEKTSDTALERGLDNVGKLRRGASPAGKSVPLLQSFLRGLSKVV